MVQFEQLLLVSIFAGYCLHVSFKFAIVDGDSRSCYLHVIILRRCDDCTEDVFMGGFRSAQLEYCKHAFTSYTCMPD